MASSGENSLTLTAELVDEISAPVQKIKTEVTGLGTAVKKTGAQAATAGKDLDGAGKAAKDTGAGMDQATGKANRFGQAMATAGKKVDDAAKYLDQHKKQYDALAKSATTYGVVAVAAVAGAVKQYADFSSRMAQVQSLSHASAGDMTALTNAALSMGTAYGMSANQVADAQIELVKAGASTKDMLDGALKGALSLAAAGQINVADATQIATVAMTQFGLSGRDVPHVADLLAAGADKALGSVSDLGYALAQGGLVASQMGLSVEDTVGALSAFAQAGLLGQDAGTSFKTMIQALQNPSTQSAGMMRELGLQVYDTSGKFVGLTTFAGQLHDKLAPLTQAQRDQAMATIFGSDAVRAATVLYQQGATGMQKWVDTVNESGFASEQASGKMNSLGGDITKFTASVQTAFIDMGSSSDGVLRPMVQGATDLIHKVQEIPDPIKSAGFAIVGISGVSLLALVGIKKLITSVADFKSSLETLGVSSDTVKGKLRGVADVGLDVAAAFAAAEAAGRVYNDLSGNDKKLGISDATLQNAIKTRDVAASTADIVKQFNSIDGTYIKGQGSAFKQLFDAQTSQFSGLSKAQSKIGNHLFGVTSNLDIFDSKVKSVSDSLANIASSGDITKASAQFAALNHEVGGGNANAQKLLGLMPSFRDSLVQQATAAGMSADKSAILNLALGKAQLAGDQAKAGGQAAAAGLVEAGTAAKALTGNLKDQIKADDDAAKAAQQAAQKITDAYAGAYTGLVQPLQTWQQMVSDASAKSKGAVSEFAAAANLSLDAYLDKLQQQVDAQTKWADNMTTLAGRVSTDVLDRLAQMGPEAAPLVAKLSSASQPELDRFVTLFQKSGADAGQTMADELQQRSALLFNVGNNLGQGVVDRLTAQLKSGMSVADAAAQLGATIEKNAGGSYELHFQTNTDPVKASILEIGHLVTAIPGHTLDIKAPSPAAQDALRALGIQVNGIPHGMVHVSADQAQINGVEQRLLDLTRNRTVTVSFNMMDNLDTTTMGTPGYARTHPYSPKLTKASRAMGGPLPGWSPGRDIHHFFSPTAGQLDLSGGEFISRPEVTAAAGPMLEGLNAAARAGGTSAVHSALAGMMRPLPGPASFANGGVWNVVPDLGSLNAVMNTGADAVDAAMGRRRTAMTAQAPAGAGVQRWHDLAAQALAMNGLSTDEGMVQRILRQIQTESGGNERAIQGNIGDINNRTGQLARGLMQVIPPTFAANAFPGHTNPFNGFDSLLAGINYAKHRYGPSLSFLGQGHGYARGGVLKVNSMGLYDQGGDLPHGGLALNLSGQTERVLTAPQARRADAGGDTVTVTIQTGAVAPGAIIVQDSGDPSAAAQAVRNELTKVFAQQRRRG